MAEETIPQGEASSRRTWQWSWWKALLGAAAVIVVLGGGLQSGIIGSTHLMDHLNMLLILPLTFFFAGLSMFGWAYWRGGRKIELETGLQIIGGAGVCSLISYALVMGTNADETCKLDERLAGPFYEQLREACYGGVGAFRLLQHYSAPSWWIAGIVTGALAGTGLYWMLPHHPVDSST
ncbi:hypothetical protein [Pseudarthrobacter sp. NPDC080039]|uniref:hypothetical protein n=1 Tax=unclassified Pseudarthrobacter TaxID=2647000 RepID=UPI00344E221A